MPEADRPDTNPPPEPEPLPTVFDLGRHLAALWERQRHHDEARTASRDLSQAHLQADADYRAVDDEIDAVEALVFARPVRSLTDGAALAVTAFRLAEYLDATEGPDDCKVEMRRLLKTTARLSVLLMEHAGQPLEVLTGPESAALIARHAGTGEIAP